MQPKRRPFRERASHGCDRAAAAYEIDNVRHNADGFPIEDDRARARPEVFRLVYDNPQVRLYAVGFPR